jgi:V8-like Glu-specific endopeptidase
MCYINRPNELFVGTGWLITDSLIATAGHCVYDSKENGTFLKYIKIYFGYNGPDSIQQSTCVYRYGAVAAAPAEYLKAPSYTHDVGFVSTFFALCHSSCSNIYFQIQLNSPISDITPITYIDTPLKASMELGVVGYPAELDYGSYMYEDWEQVNIDLSQSGSLLNYKIDTTGGSFLKLSLGFFWTLLFFF